MCLENQRIPSSWWNNAEVAECPGPDSEALPPPHQGPRHGLPDSSPCDGAQPRRPHGRCHWHWYVESWSKTEDCVDPASMVSGRKVQRPRLGVRVPYRNLTSQIVTQDEIAQEILQRSLRKNNAPTNAEVKDVFFAMKLTQRLANRLTTSPGKAEEEQVDDPLSVFPEAQQENKQQ
ncbi:hypothetical protein B566_EDAN013663, partial [Ephemera danica]